MLDIVVGVASMVAPVMMRAGATQRIQDRIASIDGDIIIVIRGKHDHLRVLVMR